MKKLFTTFFALGMAMSLAACNKGKGKSNPGPTDDREAIAVVDVFGVNNPSALVRSGALLESIDVNSEQYSLDTSETRWTYPNEQGYQVDLQKSYSMDFEIAYTLKLVLYASEGYKFTDNTAITINSNIETPRTEIANNGRTLKIYKAFDALDPVVHQVIIQGVTEPVGGEFATTTGIETYNCEGARVEGSTTATFWTWNGDYKFPNGNQFTAGTQYTIKVQLEGRHYDYYGESRQCTFADDVAVIINGKPVANGNITFHRDTSISARYTFTATTPEE